MYLYEYQAKKVVGEAGIPIPVSRLALTPEEAKDAVQYINKPAVVKAQVRAGGRGKAGLIQTASSPEEALTSAKNIFGKTHHEELVEKVLVEEQLNISKELYVSFVLDFKKGQPVALISSRGGVDIEQVAESNPEAIVKVEVDPLEWSVPEYRWVEAWRKVGLEGKQLVTAASITSKLLSLFYKIDAVTVEINPLVVTSTGAIIAADSKVIVDDSSLYRHPELAEYQEVTGNELELEALKVGVSYVPINSEGYIGIIAGGAGLSMATMDAVFEYGGIPAAFLDLGGGISETGMAESLKIMLKTQGMKGIIINVFGGINNCEIMARGIKKAFDEVTPQVPIVVKMRGHSQDEGWKILEKLKLPIIKYGTTDEAIKLLLSRVNLERGS
ncbi:MAG: ADP-forming succinate--CoA ligase subunit beta [Bacillota bacterium]